MRGPKLNEGATMATMASGERHGTKATAKYVRSSASKARVVLDLIRGLDVKHADEVLQFTERGIAKDIRKVLASAVANATNPDNTGSYIGDADELFVIACFADEGPTLRRFRPRARGRATRIRKRTSHITVVVARMSERRLEVARARADGESATDSAKRRARVERSRTRAQAARSASEGSAAGSIVDDIDDIDETDDIDEADAIETVEVETVDVATFADAGASDEGSASGTSSGAESERREDERTDDEGAAQHDEAAAQHDAFAAGEWAGSMLPDTDGNGPDTHPIKGNADSMLYHTPDSRYYTITKAEVWFDTEDNAEAAGFTKPGAQADDAETENN